MRKADLKTRLKKDDCTVIVTSVVIVTTQRNFSKNAATSESCSSILALFSSCHSSASRLLSKFQGQTFSLNLKFSSRSCTADEMRESHENEITEVGKSRVDASCFSKLRPSLNFSPCHFYASFSLRASCCHYCCCIFVSYSTGTHERAFKLLYSNNDALRLVC